MRSGIMACSICNLLLFTATLAASQQNNESLLSQGKFGGSGASYHPPCTDKGPKPNCIPNPQVVSAPPATYSEQARKAKIEGSVILGLVVDERGNLTNFRVISGLGMGLDVKAIEAVKRWTFDPAFGKDGKPVAAKIVVEVDFHL